MTSSGQRLAVVLTIALLLSGLIFVAQARVGASADDRNSYLTNGKVSVTIDSEGIRVIGDNQMINATDYYHIYTKFYNLHDRSKTIQHTFYVVNVIDQNGYTVSLEGNTYGTKTAAAHGSSGFQLQWAPQEPGEYTIKTFLVSDWHDPQIASTVATAHVKVYDKIDALGEGESNIRLQVEGIDPINNSVSVSYIYCDEIIPYMHETEAKLSFGDYVSIRAVDAVFLGMKEDKAVFRFMANGGTDFCLV